MHAVCYKLTFYFYGSVIAGGEIGVSSALNTGSDGEFYIYPLFQATLWLESSLETTTSMASARMWITTAFIHYRLASEQQHSAQAMFGLHA